MISDIKDIHHEKLVAMNSQFVHWLSPLDAPRLYWLLERADYARQIHDGAGMLIAYPSDVDYPDHKNIKWLSNHLDKFYYIDRIIIDEAKQGNGLGQILYDDVEDHARQNGFKWIACEVNTRPNNPGSHRFHLNRGYDVMGDADYPAFDAALRYYKKEL